ncbi:MAG: lipase family protein [Coriobacteriia bacterium]|nr:lipase family protein [Coriobacteriia bacterium]MBS5477104.1 lipase family protein [Coriobacteriia bacterium]
MGSSEKGPGAARRGHVSSAEVAPVPSRPGSGAKLKKKPFKRRIFFASIVAVLVAALCICAVLVIRSIQERHGLAAVADPIVVLNPDGPGATQRAFSAELSYVDIASGDVPTTTTVNWDDDWFFRDSTAYNQQLATTCAVLSAIANAESDYYQASTNAPAYMEEALAQLGFDSVSTTSYRYRSEVVDEVLDAVTRGTDVVAYSLATKHLRSSDGRERTLVMVAVRGSYGSEWISNVNLGASAAHDTGESDHLGFSKAAQSVIDDVSERAGELAAQGQDVALLFCGHSRGGAIANLAASYADDIAHERHALAPLDAIYAYTFATPQVTRAANTADTLYDNIFNVLNPSDLVPRFPLETWGYHRYGTDVWLPGIGDAGFAEAYAGMQVHYLHNVGAVNPSDPNDRFEVDELVEKFARDIPSVDAIVSPRSLWSIATGLFHDIDVVRVLCSHYPGTYIAWLQATAESAGDALEDSQ